MSKPKTGEMLYGVGSPEEYTLFNNKEEAIKHREEEDGRLMTQYQRVGLAELLQKTVNEDYLLDTIIDAINDNAHDHYSNFDNMEFDPLWATPPEAIKAALTAALRTMRASLQNTPTSVLEIVLQEQPK